VNTRRQVILATAAAVIVTLLFFLILLKPKLSEVSKTKNDVELARQQEQTLQVELQHLQAVRKNAPETMAKLAALSQYLPATPDLPGFIQLVQDAATQSSLDLQTIAPSSPAALSTATGVETIPVTLTAQGGFFRIEDFLARLENLQRVVEVRTINLTPTSSPLSNEVILTTTISLQMFVAQSNATASAGPAPPAASISPSPSASGTP
jgi:Tfp pilus assembly protein PilO